MSIESIGWLGALGEDVREKVFAIMRAARDKSEYYYEECKKLSPPHGMYPAGAAHIDPLIVAESLSGFLAGLSEGSTPEEAVEAGRERARLTVSKWHEKLRKNEHTMRRDKDSGQGVLEGYWRQVVAVCSQSEEVNHA